MHIAQAARRRRDFCLMHLYPIDGAVRRVAKDATAWQRARRDVVDGDRRHRSRSEERGGAEDLGPRLLEGRPPVQHGAARYVNFMMDDEADGPRRGDLRRQLRAARRDQGEVRSRRTCSG